MPDQADEPHENTFTRTRFARTGGGLEFDRVANFADAIYAIALTLIVVGIGVPRLDDESSGSELFEKLGALLPDIITFFVVFFVVGNYWLAHHRFMSWLNQVDSRLMHLQLVYLSIIAFLPFPAVLLGSLDENAVALAIFAIAMAAVSLFEVIMTGHAHRADLMRTKLSERGYRWGRFAQLTPVAVFLLSIPLAFISTWLAIAFWFANVPIGVILSRHEPAEFRSPS